MAIPRTLKEIDEKKALSIINRHNEGYWEDNGNINIGGDFIYDGRMTKYGYKRPEMLRLTNICGKKIWEQGIVLL